MVVEDGTQVQRMRTNDVNDDHVGREVKSNGFDLVA